MSLTTQDLDSIKGVVTQVVTRIMTDAMDQIVIPGFERLDSRIDGLEDRMTRIEGELAEVKSRLHAVEKEISSLGSRVDKVEGTLEALQNDVKVPYFMAKEKQGVVADAKFARLSPEAKMMALHSEIAALDRLLLS